jgi:DNA helicase-2/ATP-dependent DNA helicase PcrA
MLAGAGTGKTKALTARIVHLLTTGRARPNEILAVTFTNKAAREMKERVGRMLGETVEGMPWMGTFHSISVKILRRHAELAGLKSNFTILDTDDQLRLLKQVIAAADIDEKRWPARMLAGLIDGWKNRALTPARVPSAEAGAYDNRGTELYAAYQERLRTLNAVDFGDLLLHVVTILQAHPDVLAQYQRWFKFILVDEYQDTNVAQYLWLRLLAQTHHNICCVGDDDQSIYGWRGAEVGNILRFEADFPGATVIRLEQNYRSTAHILAAASGIIAANSDRLGKTLWTKAQGGEKVRLIGHWDGEEEARWIGEEVDALAKGRRTLPDVGLDDMAILVRASHQMRAFEDRFLTIGLPYRVIGGPRFYERLEVRDAMAYFRLAVSPDDDLAFERVVNTPKRGLGDKAQQSIQMLARANGLSLHEGARMLLADGGLAGKGAGQLRAFVQGIDRWHAATRQAGHSHIELAELILDESGYTAMWQNDKTPEAPGRLENLKELIKALEGFENLQGFLEHIALIMENDTEDAAEKVSIMTLHAAKGLEFPVVFLPGWEDGLFPSQRSMDESGKKGLEEERRLAYVGLTRAEELATISFAANRRVYGQWQNALPSRFIDELPEAHVEVLTPPGLYGGGYGAAGMASSIETKAMNADVYNSPGWRRMQDRAANRPVSQPRETRDMVINATALSSFATGDRAFHDKFGYGTVVGIEGDKLDIAFDKAGIKKIVARFVRSAEAAGDVPF